MAEATHFLSKEEQQRIVAAIQEAETQTSGEVKVHIEKNCPHEVPLERAKEVFTQLGLHQTQLHNGVLFYLAYEDRKFAVLGDKGIYEQVPVGFWDSTKDLLRQHFSQGTYADGLCLGIREAGLQLKKYFPYQADDINELPDDISFG
ncbi:TPM domain-containing protein [Rhabdobacter roseus]|uniref:Putative membrane protein n=1 Tax=Rhabdobacter roseus TaxID=1655419 RepID=A0A840TFS6_9BACT|nr:TPM domain-containing protein [Rhabdobacter roseus]MBB5282344.1 putative membrane protein [Rhabdobacter roseus]